MREVQATVAKARLSELLRDVERGESITITRNGKKVAALVPIEDEERSGEKRLWIVSWRCDHSGSLPGCPGKRFLPLGTRVTGFERDRSRLKVFGYCRDAQTARSNVRSRAQPPP